MCGIIALLKRPSTKTVSDNQSKQIIECCEEYVCQRGPDQKFKSDNLAFYRLSINDTTSSGLQPFVRDGTIVMCNGEIYNHKQLEEKYDVYCDSKSDCEVILHLYNKIGFVKMYKQLDGYFAIFIDDGDFAYVVRDRIGVRPLFLGTHEDFYVVSSVPGGMSEFTTQISHINPGHCMRYNKKTDEWTTLYIDQPKLALTRIQDNQVKTLHNIMITAVRKRLMTDRPIGCLLSGGLDSSIVVAILCKLIGPQNVRTYSIGMEGSTDLKYAKQVAEYLHTQHTEVLFTPDEGFAEIPNVVKTLGTYDITTIRASVGMYMIAKYIAQNTTDRVILSGEGSDELFCGYLYFHNAPSPQDAEEESLRLIKNLHLYDVLRADRTISSHGLELRVPFLDKDVLEFSLALKPEDKIPAFSPHNSKVKFEKLLLRQAFESYLPKEVVWRRKEGFSDGVSGLQKSWFSHIQDRVEKIIPDELYNPKYHSKEAMYYKLLFGHYYSNYNLEIEYWLPKWTNTKDPSGRMVSAYDQE
jgi:asparagine synthase (glutamine-hydrolysing)